MDGIESAARKVGLAPIKPKQREAISVLVTGNDILFIFLPTGTKHCRVSQQLFGSLQNFRSYTCDARVLFISVLAMGEKKTAKISSGGCTCECAKILCYTVVCMHFEYHINTIHKNLL